MPACQSIWTHGMNDLIRCGNIHSDVYARGQSWGMHKAQFPRLQTVSQLVSLEIFKNQNINYSRYQQIVTHQIVMFCGFMGNFRKLPTKNATKLKNSSKTLLFFEIKKFNFFGQIRLYLPTCASLSYVHLLTYVNAL